MADHLPDLLPDSRPDSAAGSAADSAAASPDTLPRRSAAKWALLVGLVGALLWLGHYSPIVQGVLARTFTSGVRPVVRQVAGGATLTTRSLPAMLTYGLLYVGLSVLTLHVALADRRRTRMVLLAYGGAFALIGGLLVVGQLTGLAATLTPLARTLIDGGAGGDGGGGGLLSPLPVLLLLAFFRLAPQS